MVKIGVAGAGHLGKIHIKCIQSAQGLSLVGFYDTDAGVREKVAAEFGIKAFDDYNEMLRHCDAVDIVVPTIFHHKIAKKAIEAGKHIFIEKPITHTLAEAEELLDIAKQKKLKIQVGHVERFNPAFLAISQLALNPMFIEAHRLAAFNPRGTDVSVVLDLMIHDIDIILACVKSEVKEIRASGVSIISNTPDISNVRLEFENGAVANLTASRISMKQMRKLRIFQPDAYISLDFLEKSSQIIRLYNEEPEGREGTMLSLDTPAGSRFIEIEMPESAPVNAIQMELEKFCEAIVNDTQPIVSGEQGYHALKLALKVLDEIEEHTLRATKMNTNA